MSATNLTADLYFVSALRAGADRSRTRLLPLANLKEPLAPHGRFAQRMLLALQSLGYIEPELSLSWADDWLDSRDWLSHGFEHIGWRILRSPGACTAAIHVWSGELCTSADALKTWAVVWESLALAEVAEYAQCSLADTGFNPNWANDATEALQAGLAQFSIHQIMYLVHIALRSLALEQRRPFSRNGKPGHAFSAAIRNYVRRAVAERWMIRGMAHPSEQPRSAITAVFAEAVTGLGERYYTERPSLDALVRTVASRQAHQ
ncbi:hypothetical protein DFR29_121115 [Tahibacter aquaticus]|uniref:Uncharacterized protein n=1 Tax=Tahibacter aquaticus TaxID=520092 RepID=A0A4R6YM59_9GAMM|nr:hypothetical protein [Tahibacter aquaticus]TDR38443.1 hypothetical protein DFR29_121115 [Tahibacter aquaticus]